MDLGSPSVGPTLPLAKPRIRKTGKVPLVIVHSKIWFIIIGLPPISHLFTLFPLLNLQQYGIPWRKFFDLESLRKFVRVIEFDEYLEERFGSDAADEMFVDQILYLQQFPFDGNWESRIKEEDCKEQNYYEKDERGRWRGIDLVAKYFRSR